MKHMKQQSEHVQHRNLENLTALATFPIKMLRILLPASGILAKIQ
jgi:hypothetical protein